MRFFVKIINPYTTKLTNKLLYFIGFSLIKYKEVSIMIYEFIATLSAGFALAGIALVIRHLAKLVFKKNLPKWIIPLFAAIGIFGFQIHQEYNWYKQTAQQLPKGTEVIKSIETSTWYRPWTYLKPYTVRFMALDTANVAANSKHPNIKLANLYLFERRLSTKQIPQIIDCKNNKRADYTQTMDLTSLEVNKLSWQPLKKDDKLLTLVCD